MNGRVVLLSTTNGYGFITPESGAADVFFNARQLVGVPFGALQTGMSVSFDIGLDAEDRVRAVDVRVLDDARPTRGQDCGGCSRSTTTLRSSPLTVVSRRAAICRSRS